MATHAGPLPSPHRAPTLRTAGDEDKRLRRACQVVSQLLVDTSTPAAGRRGIPAEKKDVEMADKIKREARARMARTGESYTEARRAVAHTTDVATAAADPGWPWPAALDRLDALAATLRHAEELLERLEAARALRPPRQLPGWMPMLRAVRGDEWGTRHGLLDAVNDVIAAADPTPLVRARSWHLHWYAQQAWALVTASAQAQEPVEVGPVLPAHEYDWEPPTWHPPADAADVAGRAGSASLAAPVVDTLADIQSALAASNKLAEWSQDLAERHAEACEDLDDGRCHHSPGPSEYQLDAWAALEDAASGYEPALAAFCDAARVL
ncbi:hypothetical protein, partial [Salinispora arenicola]|uniref:hypothetical protein n=1 Tax=Salinispora arenicola TaxID=168697 RepID=UPI0005167DE6